MAIPISAKPELYMPVDADFALIADAKKFNKLYPILSKIKYDYDKEPYYEAIRTYLACILLQWRECGLDIEKSLKQYYNFTDADLKLIRAWAIKYSYVYAEDYKKYMQLRIDLPEPKDALKKAIDARKGEITVNNKGLSNYFRIIPYSMAYDNGDPTKKQQGCRMHLFFGKKEGNTFKIVIRGANLYGCSESDRDEPLFATEQEARDFIANVDHNHINTKVSIEDWRFVITSGKPLTRWDSVNRVNVPITDLSGFGAVKVNTICGPAYMQKDSRRFNEI